MEKKSLRAETDKAKNDYKEQRGVTLDLKKEKDDLLLKLKAIQDSGAENSNTVVALRKENADMKQECDRLTKLALDREGQFNTAEKQNREFQKQILEVSKRADWLEGDLKRAEAIVDKFNDNHKGIQSSFDKMKQGQDTIEQTLSCLSCLEYLTEKPLTLVCGHSIC